MYIWIRISHLPYKILTLEKCESNSWNLGSKVKHSKPATVN